MKARARPRSAVLPGALDAFGSGPEGAWTVVARRDYLDTARSFVRRWEGLFPAGAAVASGGVPDEGDPGGGAPGTDPGRRRAGGPGRGGILAARDDDGRRLIVKALRRGGLTAGLGGGYHGRSRLIAEMAILEEARARGVPAARVAFGATTALPRGVTAAVLATYEIEGASDLAGYLRWARSSRATRQTRSDALARGGVAVRRAHDLGLDHADLNIGNLLLKPPRRPVGLSGVRSVARESGADALGAWVIDLGVSRFGAPLQPGRRASNLARLLRSAEKHLGGDPQRGRDAAAFLHGYLAAADGPSRPMRRALLRALRRRLPLMALHRLGWALKRRR